MKTEKGNLPAESEVRLMGRSREVQVSPQAPEFSEPSDLPLRLQSFREQHVTVSRKFLCASEEMAKGREKTALGTAREHHVGVLGPHRCKLYTP